MSSANYFTGYFRIAQDPATTAALDAYITKYEKKYLVELLGFELYTLFIADLHPTTNIPQSARFIAIYNELYYEGGEALFYPVELAYLGRSGKQAFKKTIQNDVPTLSEGISLMLKGFVYFEFVKEYGIRVTQTGIAENQNENSNATTGAKHLGMIEDRFNEAVKSYKVIHNYILGHPIDYPEFKGIPKEASHWGGAF